MTRRALAVLFGCGLLAACSSHERPSGGDAGTDPDGGGSGPLCVAPQPPLTLPDACGSLPELAVAANAVTGVPPVPTYRAELSTETDAYTSACAVDGVRDGLDTVVRFTAPTGGRWRLTAHGDGLRTLSTLRDCATATECQAFDQYEGPHVAPTFSLDLYAQRDESYAIVLDGCDTGVCNFTLSAARIGPLECPPTFAGSPCDAEATRCAIDPCDSERFVCVPAPDPYDPHPLESATVQVDRSEALALVSARVRDLPTGPYDGWGILFYEWLAADGSVLPRGSVTANVLDGPVEAGTIGPRLELVAAEALAAERVRLWFGFAPDAMADAIEIPVTVWDRGSAGEACEVGSLSTQCVRGHRCVGTGATGTCVRSERLEITAAEAWYSAKAPWIRLGIEGLTPGQDVTATRIELVDASGASLIELPLVHLIGPNTDLAKATFEASTQLDPWRVEAALIARAATLRVRVITAESVESLPRDVPIGRATELESGASCSDVNVACGDALSCVLRTGGSYCEPTVESGPCFLDGRTALWAPPGSGTYTIAGVPRAWGGSTSCIATRTMSPGAALFIAPVSGRYVFESDGLFSLEVMRSCEMPACLLDEPRMRIEVDLTAGERVPVRILSDPEATDRFSLRVEVP